jgi:maltooligosyltrehalose trehalohydrolase
VRSFFIDNAAMWLLEYRFDGLRFDAVHAIQDPTFLQEMAATLRKQVGADRHVWLMLENEHNQAHLLEQGYDAQWNDDGHNVLHALLTGESEAYYADFSEQSTEKLARCLSQGFIYQGDTNQKGESRGEPSGHLPPSAFVLFLQNHDQIGNRAMGERLNLLCSEPALRAATVLLLLSPMIPMLFMGDEWAADEPFLFFTDHHGELAKAVREGRRAEFAAFDSFANEATRAKIPDPNAASTFEASCPDFAEFEFRKDGAWVQLYRQLLALRSAEIVPRLDGAQSLGAHVLAEKAVTAKWRMSDGSVLRIDLNLSEATVPVQLPTEDLLFDSRPHGDKAALSQGLPALTALVSLTPAGAAEKPA